MTTAPLRHTMNHRYLGLFRSSHRSYSVEKCALKNFANFLGKHLCWSLFFNSVAGTNFICERLLLFVSPQNTIKNSSGEFGLDQTSTECKVSIFLKTNRSSHPEVFCKKNVFLEISRDSQENTCARVSFLIKLQ